MKNMIKMAAVAVVTLGCGYSFAESITKPNTFAPGSVISSSAVNGNFDTLYTQVNKLGSVINVDQTKKQLSINTTASEIGASSAALIVSAPHGSDQTQNGIFIMNSTLPQVNLGHVGAISKRSDGALSIYGYIGGPSNTSQFAPITFHRNGAADTGEVMRIHSNGNVGIGTTAPEAPLDISNSVTPGNNQNGYVAFALLSNLQVGKISSDSVGSPVLIPRSGNQDIVLSTWSTNPIERLRIRTNGNIGMGVPSPTYPLHMASGAYVTTGGTWTNASSREYKDNIAELSLESAQTALLQLNPVTFTYKNEPDDQHVGFIAEDVPELVAAKDRKGLSPMDTVAVVTKVVQEQQKTIKAQEETIQKQGREIQALTAMLQQTLAQISTIQHKVNQIEAAQQNPMLQKASYTEMVH